MEIKAFMSMFIIVIFLNFTYLFNTTPITKIEIYFVTKKHNTFNNKLKKSEILTSWCRRAKNELDISIISMKHKNRKKLKFMFL